MKAVFHLVHDEARRRAVQAAQAAPDGYVVKVSPPNRNLAQNALIHAVLTEAGDALGWVFNGQVVDLDDLKTIFMAAYRKQQGGETRFVIGIDGQPVILSWRTRDLTKAECSDFIESVQAFMAMRGRA
jgi:hypothetical protein